MSDQTITNLLTQLHGTLEGATTITEKDRELLKKLSADIQELLAESDTPMSAEHASLSERLQTAITQFEVTHPALTATLSNVSKKLGDMGI